MGSDYLQQLWAGLEERICTCGVGHGSNEAHHIGCEWLEPYSTVELLMAMRDAGYRILAPGEVDAETLERAAEVARHVPTPADVQDQMLRLGYISASQAIADAIRAKAQESGR